MTDADASEERPAPLPTRWAVARVTGPSMSPTVRHGDRLLVRRIGPGDRVRDGDVVLARFPSRPELLVVKRAVEPVSGGWLVASDNPAVEGRGWTGGEVDVLARVVLRYWPPAGWGRPSRRPA